MYTITGATGRVGSVVARTLLEDGETVRVVVRDPAKATPFAERGAEVVVADHTDQAGLTAALTGADGAFLMLPFDPATADFLGDTRRMADAIATAVAASGVPHVAMLSSIGADLPSGTGPIWGLHLLEQQLRGTDTVLSALRSGHFQEKVSDVLDAAIHDGVYPVFGDADVAKPMIATRDVGELAARTLQRPPAASEVVDIDGPRYTEREVATHLGEVLGRSLEVVSVPRPGWVGALVDAGLTPHVAEVLAGLHDADDAGRLVPRGDRTVRATTALPTTLASLVGVRA